MKNLIPISAYTNKKWIKKTDKNIKLFLRSKPQSSAKIYQTQKLKSYSDWNFGNNILTGYLKVCESWNRKIDRQVIENNRLCTYSEHFKIFFEFRRYLKWKCWSIPKMLQFWLYSTQLLWNLRNPNRYFRVETIEHFLENSENLGRFLTAQKKP